MAQEHAAGGRGVAADFFDHQNRFYFYDSCFDAIGVIRRFEQSRLAPADGLVTNFLGVKVRPEVFPPALADHAGTVEGAPIPANWHADIAEWATALRAVELSGRHFFLLELGYGWGCWMNNTEAAARTTGRSVRLIGIEGDGGHVEFARDALDLNGFKGEQATVIHGVAGPKEGMALFPLQDIAGEKSGLEPILYPSESQCEQFSKSHQRLPAEILESLRGGTPMDRPHIDIQGGEFEFVKNCIDDINRGVRYMLIGAHSRAIEGALETFLNERGWLLEMDRPAYVDGNDDGPSLRVDGVHGWRNLG